MAKEPDTTMSNVLRPLDDRDSDTLLLERLAESLSIDPATFYAATPSTPVSKPLTDLNADQPVERALSQALDRVEDAGLRNYFERLLCTLEAQRLSRHSPK
jgi:hypothetical protein